jgi:hypothetical protein
MGRFVHNAKPSIEIALPAAGIGPTPLARLHLLDLDLKHHPRLHPSESDRATESVADR